MASLEKYPAQSVGMIFKHNNRTPDENIERENDDIDIERTKYNYHIKKGTAKDVSKRVDDVYSIGRKDAVVLVEAVVTMPKDLDPKDERNFFRAVYDFYAEDFGEENIINAVVHKDEKNKEQPHIHIDMIPVAKTNISFSAENSHGQMLDKWKKEKGIKEGEEFERLCAKEILTKKYYDTMHPRLNQFVKDRLGYEVSIINGATANGNKTVQELKIQSLEKEAEKLQIQIQNLNNEKNRIYQTMKSVGINENTLYLMPLLQEIEYLKNKNSILEKVVMRNRCSFTREELEAMKPIMFKGSKAAHFNIFNGTIANMKIEQTAIVIIELPDTKERPIPLQKLLDNKEDFDVQVNYMFAKKVRDKVILRNTKGANGRIYIFVKTDDERMTIDRLIEMGKLLEREVKESNRKIYMDRFEYDQFDFAKSVLERTGMEVTYCTRLETEERIIEEAEKDKPKEITRPII